MKVEMKWLVHVRESESGWGQRIDEVKEFDTPEEAESFVEDYNRQNDLSYTPDWYTYAVLAGTKVVK